MLMVVFALAAPPSAAAVSSPGLQSFDQLIGGMKLVVLAQIGGSETQGYRYTVERVLKGSAGSVLTFPPDLQAAVQPGWSEAVIAFADPTTDDFRAPTVAWHVAADGIIDPEKFQQYPGLPPTLTAMLAYFGQSASPSASASASAPASPPAASVQPSTEAAPAPSPVTPVPSAGPSPILWGALIVLLVVAAAIGFRAWSRRR